MKLEEEMKDRDPILQQYGSVVREIRRERHLSQEELAHQSGLHRTYITDIERGARNVSLRNIIRIAEALKIPLGEFFTRFDSKLHGDPPQQGPVTILLAMHDEGCIGQLIGLFEQMIISNPVHVVRNAEDANRYLLPPMTDTIHRSPLVVFLDPVLTALQGRDILQELRKDPRTRSLPVILHASDSHESDLVQYRQYGVDEILPKPLTAQSFSAMMHRLGYRLSYCKSEEHPHPKIGQITP
jgi:transcriptional regulator with XRE-family HTH domain